jgi:hypothetical protein
MRHAAAGLLRQHLSKKLWQDPAKKLWQGKWGHVETGAVLWMNVVSWEHVSISKRIRYCVIPDGLPKSDCE